MAALLVWGYAFSDLDTMEKRKIPMVATGMVGISESFNRRKTHPDFDFEWVGFRKGEKIPPMPAEVFVCLKRVKTVNFDFLPYDTYFFIMSEEFFDFVSSHGLNAELATSRAHIVDTKGRSLTDKPFVLARVIPWELQPVITFADLHTPQSGFSLDARVDLPSGVSTSSSGVFLTDNMDYSEAFLVTDDLVDEITSRFSTPFLYSLEEWKSANDSNSYWF